MSDGTSPPGARGRTAGPPAPATAVLSVVVPAHDEARVVTRLLDGLAPPWGAGALEVVVVANGCRDDTADVVRRHAPWARVVELEAASKHLALEAGDAAASVHPRAYVDADVVVGYADLLALAAALTGPVHAAAPERELDEARSSRAVRPYHRVWSRLPAVRDGLHGRGVLVVDAEGGRRLAGRPQVQADDLVVHHAFAAHERVVLRSTRSQVTAPRTLRPLVLRRSRAAAGNREHDARDRGLGGAGTDSTARSARSVLLGAARDPRRWADVAVFLAVTALARAHARLARGGGWLRDDSSR